MSIGETQLLKPELVVVFGTILVKYANHLMKANRGLIICNTVVTGLFMRLSPYNLV